jgi:hypothetical protein
LSVSATNYSKADQGRRRTSGVDPQGTAVTGMTMPGGDPGPLEQLAARLEATNRWQVQQEMTALTTAVEFCRELDRRNITYELRIVRDEALMMSVAVPGERWEIEFFDDGTIELERFISQGVAEAPSALAELLAWFDE